MAAKKKNMHVPLWLKWLLASMIITNVVSYVVVTWLTINQMDEKVEILKNETVNIGKAKGNDAKERYEHLVKIQDIQSTRSKLIAGSTVQIALDLIDLVDIYMGSLFIHGLYLIMKMLSVGLWAFTQTGFGQTVLWCIPIGAAMLVTLTLLKWFQALQRKWVLILVLLVASFAWFAVVTVRIMQIRAEIDQAHEQINKEDKAGERSRLLQIIEENKSNETMILIGSFFMILFGTLVIISICIGNPWICLLMAVLHGTGITVWLVHFIEANASMNNGLFIVPLIYSVLLLGVLLVYIVDMFQGRHHLSTAELMTMEMAIEKSAKRAFSRSRNRFSRWHKSPKVRSKKAHSELKNSLKTLNL